jgi:hypothetical protein
MLTYHVLIGQGGAVSTDLSGLARIIATLPSGLYEIFVTGSEALCTTRKFCVATKDDKGTIELRPTSDDEQQCVDLAVELRGRSSIAHESTFPRK